MSVRNVGWRYPGGNVQGNVLHPLLTATRTNQQHRFLLFLHRSDYSSLPLNLPFLLRPSLSVSSFVSPSFASLSRRSLCTFASLHTDLPIWFRRHIHGKLFMNVKSFGHCPA